MFCAPRDGRDPNWASPVAQFNYMYPYFDLIMSTECPIYNIF